MRRSRISPRKSLLGRANSNKSIRFNSRASEFPPSYKAWLQLKERQKQIYKKFFTSRYAEIALDPFLDFQLQECEIKLLFELANNPSWDVPRRTFAEIAESLWQLYSGSKFTHWYVKKPKRRGRDSNPEFLRYKRMAVAYINQGRSDIEKDSRRDTVVKEYGLKTNHKDDWERQAESGGLFESDCEFPFVDEPSIKWAGLAYQALKRQQKPKT